MHLLPCKKIILQPKKARLIQAGLAALVALSLLVGCQQGTKSDTQAPTTPTQLAVAPFSSTQLNLSWNPSSDNVGVTAYLLERCQGASCTNFSQVGTPSGPLYSDTGLSPSTPYRYRLRATDAAGNLSGYATANGTTQGAASGATRVFYDGFESGNTGWEQVGFRDKCQTVTVAVDGQYGPRSGSKFASCNSDSSAAWNTAQAYQTMSIPTDNYTSELFIRAWVRADADVYPIETGSGRKLLRIFFWDQVTYRDSFADFGGPSGGLRHSFAWAEGGNIQSPSKYWGDAPGDTSAEAGWHKVEVYFNHTTQTARAWHDGKQVYELTKMGFGSAKWSPLNLMSNWGDAEQGRVPADTQNHYYVDDVEVFSDAKTGTPTTGSMADGTIQAAP